VRYILVITNAHNYFVSREGSKNLVAYEVSCKIGRNWQRNPQLVQNEFKEIIHILDGELINDKSKNGEERLKYLIYDALVAFNRKIIDLPLRDRLEWCEKVIRCN
jgi:6-pyruvoyl-tetrahydropterin synthase